MNKLSKSFCFLLASVFITTAISGCSKPASSTAGGTTEKSKQVEIKVATGFTGEDPWKDIWPQVVKEYTDKNPNVKIIDETTPTQDNAFRIKVKTDIVSGAEPDVTFFFTGVDTKPIAESNKYITWEEELQKDKEWASNFSPIALEKIKYEGKAYALPYIGFYEGLICNKEIFDKYNVKIPTTYVELLTAIDTFNKNNVTPMAQSFVDCRYLIEYCVLSAAGPDGQKKPYDASWVEGLKTIKDLYDKKAFPKDSFSLTDEQAQVLFKDKKAAMIINGSWAVGNYDPKSTVLAYFPLVPNGKANPKDIVAGIGGQGWYMSKVQNEKKNGEPLKFIKYLTTPAVMAKFAAKAGVPQIKCDAPQDKPSLKSGWDMLQNASSLNSPIDSIITPDAHKELYKSIPYILTDKMSAEQILDASKKLNKQ